MTRLSTLALAAVLALTTACGIRRVRVPVLRPAEINLGAYKSLALAEFTGGATASQLAGQIEQQLVEVGRFEIIDRTHTQAVLNELKLSASDLATGEGGPKLGQLSTAGALITCDVSDRYTETPMTQTWRDAKNVEHTRRWTKGEYTLRANFKLIDVSTGRVLLARSNEARKDSEGGAGGGKAVAQVANMLAGLLAVTGNAGGRGSQTQDQPPDRTALEREAREEIVSGFIGAIAPRKEWREVGFAVDSDLPQLEAGIGWASRGEWKRAQETFEGAVSAAENNPAIASPKLAKAYRNAGLAHAYGGDHEGGLKLLNKAYELSADPALLDEIDSVKRLQDDARKLAEQGVK